MTTTATSGSQQSWLDATEFGASTTSTESKDIDNDPLAQKQLFLQLLVAQIRNQDPLNPSDGTQFVAQLSQFTGVEQMLEMNQNLEAIRAALAPVELTEQP